MLVKDGRCYFPLQFTLKKCQSCSIQQEEKEQTRRPGERNKHSGRPDTSGHLSGEKEPGQVWETGGNTGNGRCQLQLLILSCTPGSSSHPELVVFVRSFTLRVCVRARVILKRKNVGWLSQEKVLNIETTFFPLICCQSRCH